MKTIRSFAYSLKKNKLPWAAEANYSTVVSTQYSKLRDCISNTDFMEAFVYLVNSVAVSVALYPGRSDLF